LQQRDYRALPGFKGAAGCGAFRLSLSARGIQPLAPGLLFPTGAIFHRLAGAGQRLIG
jgi:hypothetical protein